MPRAILANLTSSRSGLFKTIPLRLSVTTTAIQQDGATNEMSSQNSTLTSAEAESESNTPLDAAHNAAHQIVEGVAKVLTKPRFRGWIHVYSAVTAVFAGASLVAVSWAVDSTKAGLATMLYTFATIIMFTVSATYHRVNWKSETARKWM